MSRMDHSLNGHERAVTDDPCSNRRGLSRAAFGRPAQRYEVGLSLVKDLRSPLMICSAKS